MTKSLRRRLRTGIFAPFALVAIAGFAVLPWRAAQAVGRGLGAMLSLAPRARRRGLRHLAIAFPEKSQQERQRIVRDCAAQHAQSLAEFLHLLGRSPNAVEHRLRVEGWGHVVESRRRGRAVVLMTAHYGNWELLSAAMAERHMPFIAIAQRLRDPLLQWLLLRFRSRYGTETVLREEAAAPLRLVRALRRGHAVGILIDQDVDIDGVWVPFFGRPAYTPVGAARLALRESAVVIPVFDERLPDGRHRLTFHPPLDLPPDETEATAVMTAAVEAQIRRRPEQWVWWHKRWRRQPSALTDDERGQDAQ